MNAPSFLRMMIVLMLGFLAACAGGGGPSPGSDSSEEGIASYYAPKFHGRTTASGETYDETALTAAHPTLPFGTHVRVTNVSNGKTLTLRINDRGPFVEGRILDVSYRAAEELDFVRAGLARVRIEVLRTETVTH